MGFEVMAANGDAYKLRASSAAERQDWISALKCSIELSAPDHVNMLANSIRGPAICKKQIWKQSHSVNSGSLSTQYISQVCGTIIRIPLTISSQLMYTTLLALLLIKYLCIPC